MIDHIVLANVNRTNSFNCIKKFLLSKKKNLHEQSELSCNLTGLETGVSGVSGVQTFKEKNQ